MKVIVCGSRGYCSSDYRYALKEVLHELWPISEIISGGCPNSADQLAEDYAHYYEIPFTEFPADWETHGKQAGFLRNWEMAEQGADECVAIWDGKSNGTKHMISEAVQHGIYVRIIPARL